MHETAESVILPLLGPSERLLWSGKPQSGVCLRGHDVLLIPITSVWCGVAIYIETLAIRSGMWFFGLLAGGPFVCLGLYLVVGRFFSAAKQREHTFYGVSSERIVIVGGVDTQQVQSFPLRSLKMANLWMLQKADGSGTITFGPTTNQHSVFPNSGLPDWRCDPPAFDLIEKVKDVYDIIWKARILATG